MTEVETSMARTAVRPFRINVPEEELVDLRRRILATRWRRLRASRAPISSGTIAASQDAR
jgi:hypothetical protein